MDSAERRKFPRLLHNVDVEYTVLSDRQESPSEGFSRNVSEGGICILTLDKFDIGAHINIVFSLPDADAPIKTIGKVVWVEEFSVGDTSSSKAYDAGIHFIDMSDADKERIHHHVISRL
ncbi:MAG TPA: PilZ domain-containing protein [Candidatus Omnitrophota bacterium]|nr:PilZ domain-containing protein [Candidatus Omnitrophota bacterium]HPT07617.1 PilZ domain-containing protein [Candidatus Omnitrophota bacterium]